MRFFLTAAALYCFSILGEPASAQEATSLVGSGTHLKGNGSGPDGLGNSSGTASPNVAPSVLGGDTSSIKVTPSGTPIGSSREGAAGSTR